MNDLRSALQSISNFDNQPTGLGAMSSVQTKWTVMRRMGHTNVHGRRYYLSLRIQPPYKLNLPVSQTLRYLFILYNAFKASLDIPYNNDVVAAEGR